MHKYLKYFIVLAVLFSCSDRDGNTADTFDNTPLITLVTSTSGAGDNGYNDGIIAGVMGFYEKNDVRLSLVNPQNLTEARTFLQSWLVNEKEEQQLLILASSEYEQLLKENTIEPSDKKDILLFESNSIPNVSTFRIQRYGASYLAGCIASPHRAATVVAALPNEPILTDAINGFTAGYETYSDNKVEILYLADDYNGYAMPDSAYRIASTLGNTFVYPLAGGSNTGIYKYSREEPFEMMLVAGMDADCSVHSSRIPFSVVVRTDKVIEEYLIQWICGEKLPEHNVYGLESGLIDIVISPLFNELSYIWEDYYLDDNYWQDAYNRYKEEAVRKESEYESE